MIHTNEMQSGLIGLTGSIRSVVENTVITNSYANHPLSGELSRLAPTVGIPTVSDWPFPPSSIARARAGHGLGHVEESEIEPQSVYFETNERYRGDSLSISNLRYCSMEAGSAQT